MKNRDVKNPFFSIITVVKNDESNIEKTINSVLSQNYKNFEYIIIDGKSNDKTYKNIIKHKKFINKIISESDNGLYYAMNKGSALANGKFLVFVNSGDILTQSALKIVHDKIVSNPQVDFVFGTVKRYYTKSMIIKSGFNTKRLNYNFDFATCHSTGFFVRRLKFKDIGYFNTKYKCSADYDVYYKLIIKNKLNGLSTNKNEIIGEVSAGGFSSKLSFLEHLKEEIIIRIDNGQNKLIVLLILINAVLKNFLKIN